MPQYLNAVWDEILENPQARALLLVSPGEKVPPELAKLPFRVSVAASLDPATVTVLVALAKGAIAVGTPILIDVWSNFVLPRLRKKYGEDAFKEVRRQ